VSDQSGETAAEKSREAGIPVTQYVRMSTEHQRYSTEDQAAAISKYAHGGENRNRIYHRYPADHMLLVATFQLSRT